MARTVDERRHQSLLVNLVLGVGLILLVSLGLLAWISIWYVQRTVTGDLVAEADRFSDTVKLGTHYAMMNNIRGDIMKIIGNIARRQDVRRIRIFQKDGRIMFSSSRSEVGRRVDINGYACSVCHAQVPPVTAPSVRERTRFFSSPEGKRSLGIISPIYNETGCSSASCHAHAADTTVLGILDIVISLDQVDRKIAFLEKVYGLVAVLIFFVTTGLIVHYLVRFVTRPVQELIRGTRLISRGKEFDPRVIGRNDEMGRLAEAISRMGREIIRRREELVRANVELIAANRELEEASKRDPLTGLFNRRYLVEVFALEFARARRYGHDLSVLMLDVDHFKQVNDRYGHLCGDTVLREIAGLLRKTIRTTDVIARYGGEEVVILLLETDQERAVAIAEKLRTVIASHCIRCDELQVAVTVSIGVATGPGRAMIHCSDLLDAADQAMYRAKAGGRDRVVAAGETSPCRPGTGDNRDLRTEEDGT